VASIQWADLSEDKYGVSLLNRSKYGHDVKGNIIRLSLLRSPTWPDETADRGKHVIAYALYPHQGSWREGESVRRGYEYNHPPIAVLTGTHAGQLPAEHSFLQLAPSNLVLTALKAAEDTPDAWIVRWYESQGEKAVAKLTLPRAPTKVVNSNFLEDDFEELAAPNRTISIETAGNSIQTVKVYYK
ncbi:MAG: glycoside hydrolase family 38 C-terminal domain-containing protein, partial [Candidatus Neomarinimicrobiota bacterium]